MYIYTYIYASRQKYSKQMGWFLLSYLSSIATANCKKKSKKSDKSSWESLY